MGMEAEGEEDPRAVGATAEVAVTRADSPEQAVVAEDSSERGTGSALALHVRTWTSTGGMNATSVRPLNRMALEGAQEAPTWG